MRVLLVVVFACGGGGLVSSPKGMTLDDEVGYLKKNFAFKASTSTCTDEASCTQRCAGREGRACTNVGDALYGRGDKSGALPWFAKACDLHEAVGCIGVALTRKAAPETALTWPTGSYAMLLAACAWSETTKLPAGAAGTASAEIAAGLCGHVTALDKLATAGKERDLTGCGSYGDRNACERLDTQIAAADEQRFAADKPGRQAAQAENARWEAEQQAKLARRDARLAEEDRRREATERNRVTTPVSGGRRRDRPGQLSRAACDSVLGDACERAKVFARQRGMTDEADLFKIWRICIDTNQQVVAFCVTARCGERYRYCMTEQVSAITEWDKCRSVVDDCDR